MKLFFTGCLMLMLDPLLRLPEALLRMRYMSGHYGSFKDALLKDWLFSDGWFAYIKTPLGMGYTVFLVSWNLVAAQLVAGAFFRWNLEQRRL